MTKKYLLEPATLGLFALVSLLGSSPVRADEVCPPGTPDGCITGAATTVKMPGSSFEKNGNVIGVSNLGITVDCNADSCIEVYYSARRSTWCMRDSRREDFSACHTLPENCDVTDDDHLWVTGARADNANKIGGCAQVKGQMWAKTIPRRPVGGKFVMVQGDGTLDAKNHVTNYNAQVDKPHLEFEPVKTEGQEGYVVKWVASDGRVLSSVERTKRSCAAANSLDSVAASLKAQPSVVDFSSGKQYEAKGCDGTVNATFDYGSGGGDSPQTKDSKKKISGS